MLDALNDLFRLHQGGTCANARDRELVFWKKQLKKSRNESCGIDFIRGNYLIQLRACGDVVIHHQKMELFLAFLGVDGGEKHTV